MTLFNLICWNAVKLWQQSEAIFLFDEDAFKSLLVLQNLDEFTDIVRFDWTAPSSVLNRRCPLDAS